MKKAIELIRVSTAQQAGDDRYSIPSQREANRETAAANGLEIVETIEFFDVGGADVARSPEFQHLRERIRDPKIHGVIVREFSRLIRMENLSDFSLFGDFQATNTLVYYPGGAIDFNTPAGKLLGTIQGVIGGIERAELKEKTWRAKEAKRKLGLAASSSITWPLGVEFLKDANLWRWTPEIEKVRLAFRLFLSGVTAWNELEERTGIPSFNFRTILSNPIYTGWRVIDKRRDPAREAVREKDDGRQADRRKVLRAEPIRIRRPELDPIISEPDFVRAQLLLDEKRRRNWRFRTSDPEHARFIYRGFVICSECGSPHYTLTVNRFDYYVCRSRKGYAERAPRGVTLAREDRCPAVYQNRQRLEGILDKTFSSRLTDKRFLRECLDELRRKGEARADRRSSARLQREIRSLMAKRERTLSLFVDGLIGKEDRDERLRRIDRDRAVAESGLLELTPPDVQITPESLALIFLPFFQWETLRAEDKRRILGSIVPEIRVSNYTVSGLAVLAPAGAGAKVRLSKGKGRSRSSGVSKYQSHSTTASTPTIPSRRQSPFTTRIPRES